MNAYRIYQNLSRQQWWDKQSRKRRWLAARYYSGVDSLEELKSLAKPQPVMKDNFHPPIISQEEMEEIVILR